MNPSIRPINMGIAPIADHEGPSRVVANMGRRTEKTVSDSTAGLLGGIGMPEVAGIIPVQSDSPDALDMSFPAPSTGTEQAVMPLKRSLFSAPDASRRIEDMPIPEANTGSVEKIRANVRYLNELKAAFGANFSAKLGGYLDELQETKPGFKDAPIGHAKKELIQLGIVGSATSDTLMSKPNVLPWPAISSVRSGSERSLIQPGDQPIVRTESDMLNRSKFYLSLGSENADPDILRSQQTFLVDLAKNALARGIDISWKTMSHGYDQPCVYSAKPQELGLLLSEMYNSGMYSTAIWNDVERYFQSPVTGVSDKHITVVQEPVDGFRGNSHSDRLYLLARMLDNDDVITEDRFIEVANLCGLRPDKLGYLNDAAAAEYLETGRAKAADARVSKAV